MKLNAIDTVFVHTTSTDSGDIHTVRINVRDPNNPDWRTQQLELNHEFSDRAAAFATRKAVAAAGKVDDKRWSVLQEFSGPTASSEVKF